MKVHKEHMFLHALQLGYEFGHKGISFSRLIDGLKAIGYSAHTNDRARFWVWYRSNFYVDPSAVDGGFKGTDANRVPWSEVPHILRSEALLDYIKYLEYQQALQNARKARVLSLVAIGIGVLSAVLNWAVPPLYTWFCH